jgi:hypothetical protein
MTAIAPHARVDAPAAPLVRPRGWADRRSRVTGGVVWIVIIGVLLAGVVFMNVVVLRMNIRLDELGRDRARLRADTAALSSELSSEQAAARIQAQARRDLHVVPANAFETTFLDLPAR